MIKSPPGCPTPAIAPRLLVLAIAAAMSGCISVPLLSGDSAADQAAIRTAVQSALETKTSGDAVPWANQQSGNYGTVVPVRTFQTASGLYCREYTVTILDGGTRSATEDVACRDVDGVWKDAS